VRGLLGTARRRPGLTLQPVVRGERAGVSAAIRPLAAQVSRSGPTTQLGDVAGHLLLRHHSAVDLVDRAEAAGLLRRVTDTQDQRVVRLELTGDGEARLSELAAAHLEELSRLRPRLDVLWRHLPDATP
jgi:DNA-binding MarR family transcriptional regulator